MVIAKVDAQRRLYIPKGVKFESEKAIILPYGTSYLLIPVPKNIIEIDVGASLRELKARAEEKARGEALERARRRKQIWEG
ncbi:MAG: hypothetical protein QXR65_06560 [Candidatus Bathyarchaeia archaeon]